MQPHLARKTQKALNLLPLTGSCCHKACLAAHRMAFTSSLTHKLANTDGISACSLGACPAGTQHHLTAAMAIQTLPLQRACRTGRHLHPSKLDANFLRTFWTLISVNLDSPTWTKKGTASLWSALPALLQIQSPSIQGWAGDKLYFVTEHFSKKSSQIIWHEELDHRSASMDEAANLDRRQPVRSAMPECRHMRRPVELLASVTWLMHC